MGGFSSSKPIAPAASLPAAVALGLLLGLRLPRAFAQSAADAGQGEPSSASTEMVVTGSRLIEPLRAATVGVQVVTRGEITRSGARDAAEVLEEQPGLQITRSFRGSELWLRGLDPEYTLILVDGDRVPGRIGGAVDLGRYGVENIERVEIVRGPSSALYGSDAIAGVVNIITRESKRDLEAEALASGGTQNTYDFTGQIAGRPVGSLRLSATGGVHHADDFPRPDSAATAGSERMQWSTGGSASFMPDAEQRFSLRGDYLRLSLEGVDEGAAAALFDRTQLQEQLETSLRHELDTDNGIEVSSRLSYAQFREQFLSDQRGSTELDQYEDNREHLGQLGTLVRIPWSDAHRTTVGGEQLFVSLESERLVRPGRRYGLALFAQHEWQVYARGESSLEVVPGVRLDLDSQYGQQLSPKLAVRFDPVEELALRASYGRGFRAPSFQELLLRFENPSVGYLVSGNPELAPETSHGEDLSADWEPAEWLSLHLALFRNDLEDMIAIVTVDEQTAQGTLFSYDNLERAWTMGVESLVSVQAEDYVSASVGYTLTETWDGENDRRLEGRARHRVTVSLRAAYPTWELELVARAALQFDRPYYVAQTDGTEVTVIPEVLAPFDLRVAKHITDHFELFAGIDNLLDAGDPYGALRPLTVYGGARGRY